MIFPSPFTYLHSKVAPPFSLILLSILSVSLLHPSWHHDPSYLAGKGEELQIKKPRPILLLGVWYLDPTYYGHLNKIFLWLLLVRYSDARPDVCRMPCWHKKYHLNLRQKLTLIQMATLDTRLFHCSDCLYVMWPTPGLKECTVLWVKNYLSF